MRISDIIEAEREKVRAERERVRAEARALKAERRRKYLEALSEEEREDVLERELERERERERDRTILERVEEDSFPWEKVLD